MMMLLQYLAKFATPQRILALPKKSKLKQRQLLQPRSHWLRGFSLVCRAMDISLERIIRHALEEAQPAGRDYQTQTELAVRAIRDARPEMTASEALAMVNLVRRS